MLFILFHFSMPPLILKTILFSPLELPPDKRWILQMYLARGCPQSRDCFTWDHLIKRCIDFCFLLKVIKGKLSIIVESFLKHMCVIRWTAWTLSVICRCNKYVTENLNLWKSASFDFFYFLFFYLTTTLNSSRPLNHYKLSKSLHQRLH